MTVKQFCGVDAFLRKPDGTQLTHSEMYGAIVRYIGLDKIIPFIPASLEEIQRKITVDEHLNNIPIIKWDRASDGMSRLLRFSGINAHSLSDCVCVLKEAARIWAGYENKINI